MLGKVVFTKLEIVDTAGQCSVHKISEGSIDKAILGCVDKDRNCW